MKVIYDYTGSLV